jgi:hypothetical protein
MATTTHEEQLYRVFNNVNDWLKFFEAKNAMIIVFNSASIYGITQLFNLEYIKKSDQIINYLIIVIILLVFSTLSSLISFAPRVKIIKGGLYAPGDDPNVLFFEYLKIKTKEDIIKEITGVSDVDSFAPIEKDIAEQIKQNSIIASRKYFYFTIAVWLTIAAYITIPLAGIFCLYTYLSK